MQSYVSVRSFQTVRSSTADFRVCTVLKKGGMRQAAEASNTTPAADGAVQVECHAQIAPWAVKRARIFS